MFTIEYFYICFLLLVLHFSVPLSADESTQNATTQTTVKDVTQTQNATSVPNSNAPPVFPETSTNGAKVISTNQTITSPNLNITLINSNNNMIPKCETKDNISTNNSKNATLAFPQNGTNADKSSNNNCVSSNATPDIPNLNKIDNITSAGNLSNVPPLAPSVFPVSTSNGAKVLPYNTSIATLAALNTTEADNNLLNSSGNGTSSTYKVDTEVNDLLNNTYNIPPCNRSEIPASVPVLTLNEQQNINNKETESIGDAKDTEDILRKHTNETHGPGVPLVQGQLAAILAAVFVIISVITYIGLLSWRRFLENRYGNRELLVNEDDFNDRNDMRHFTI